MKIQLDLKSAIAGGMAAALLFAILSFRNSGDNTTARFQTVAGAKSIMVLDTHSGAYIVAPDMADVGKVQWIKGTFDETFATGIDNKRVKTP